MMEADLCSVLSGICSDVFPDVGPPEVAKPYIVWQSLGGQALVSMDNIQANKRHSYMQITAWAKTRMQSTMLIQQAEDALRSCELFQAVPSGEALSTYEPETKLYGSIQRFSIWADR